MAVASTTDPKYAIKTLLSGNITINKDDDATVATSIVMYETDEIPLSELFASYDVVVTVAGPESVYARFLQDVPVQADYDVVLAVSTIDKAGITGSIMQWKTQRSIETLIEAGARPGSGVEIIISGKSRLSSRQVAGKTLWAIVYAVRYGSP